MANKKLYALVKFVSGDDAKKYSVGIPVEMIKDFDVDVFLAGDYDASEVFCVEWREKKKKPKQGWPLYDVNVIHVSGKANQILLFQKCFTFIIQSFGIIICSL